jgi:predicted GH43/DUF377 family glycosyl hydrolase
VAETPVQDDPEYFCVPMLKDDRVAIHKIRKTASFDFSDPRVIKNTDGTDRNYLTSMSHLRLAESDDGVHFRIAEKPAVAPCGKYEEYGLEDSRVTEIDGTYYITYSAASRYGIVAGLITTTDFNSYQRQGCLFHPDNKDVAIFPRRINGLYYALHRPSMSEFGQRAVWLASSPDLRRFGQHKHLYSPRADGFDSFRVGAACVPFEVNEGFLEIYHGADKNDVYKLGALLLDKDDPSVIVKKSVGAIVEPTEEYEKAGFLGGVVFACGCYIEGGDAHIYYGAADENVARVTLKIRDILDTLTDYAE